MSKAKPELDIKTMEDEETTLPSSLSSATHPTSSALLSPSRHSSAQSSLTVPQDEQGQALGQGVRSRPLTTSTMVLRTRPYSSHNFWAGDSGRNNKSANRGKPNLPRNSFNPEPYRKEPCAMGESMKQCLHNEFKKNFDITQLRTVSTELRDTQPTLQTIQTEHDAFLSQTAKARWNSVNSLGRTTKTKSVTAGDVVSVFKNFSTAK
ncbi:uncharacterized protein [Amphiura filiformis]|uniref:uncharacterized protein n=1 Tax=Amphiura filiformis TaxID=82378 RepID=UPI003B214ED1